jgi:ribosomal protein S27E
VSDLKRRVSHLAHLVDRYEFRGRGREGQMLADVVEVLKDLAEDVEAVSTSQYELEQYLEEVDTDLMSLEENVYLRPQSRRDREETPENPGDDPATVHYIRVECPVCELEASYNEDLFHQDGIQLTCPHCGNIVFDSDEDYLVVDEDEDEDEDEPGTSLQ